MSLVSSRLFLLEPVDLLGDVDRRLVLHVAQLVDLRLELGDRLLEVEEMSSCSWSRRRGSSTADSGSGSRLRQMYQVATERNGAQASPTSRASARETGSPLK